MERRRTDNKTEEWHGVDPVETGYLLRLDNGRDTVWWSSGPSGENRTDTGMGVAGREEDGIKQSSKAAG